MAADMCVTVAKYSHAIGVNNSDHNIPWIHHTASNIFLVLKGEDTYIQNGRLIMKVVQGNTALETVNVGELIDQSIEARSGSQRAGVTPQIEQLPIFGINKDIFLAFRYRHSDGRARRVQFRLKSAHDAASMVEVLKRRGMEFQQQRPRTARPTTARLGTSGFQERPLTVQASYPANRAFVAPPDPPKPSPIQMPVLEAGGLSSQHHGNTEGSFVLQRPHKQTLLQYSARSSPLQGEIRSATTYDTNHTVIDPDLSRSHTVHSQGPTDEPTTHYSDVSDHMQMAATSSHGQDRPLNEHLSKPSALLSGPRNAPLETPDIASSLTANRSSLYRPSLPPSLSMPETLEHEMPPRRELPFKRPGSHQSSSSRPSTISRSFYLSATGGGSSDQPTASLASSPAKQSDENRPATAASAKRAASPEIARPVKKAQAIRARPQSHASTLLKTSYVKSSVKPHEAAVPQNTFRRPSDLGELLRIPKPLSERSPNGSKVSRMDSTADAAYELDTPPGTSSSPAGRVGGRMASSIPRSGPTMPDSLLQHVGVGDSTPNSTAGVGAVEAALLASYASQSREDRQTVLDEFMVSKLEDPNFAVLCEDLDACWRKLALGL